jgi:hypothetical protein
MFNRFYKMGMFYDDRLYGIRWSIVVTEPTYQNSTIYEYSQGEPLLGAELEKVRAAFLALTDAEKELYVFSVYSCGTSTFDDPPKSFYVWWPCKVNELIGKLF